MQVEEELSRLLLNKDSIITVGVFDGVHLGHRHLISQVKELARQQDRLSVVITFCQHPQEILTPRHTPPHLTGIDEKLKLLENEKVDHVVALTFNRELAQLGVRQFVELLKKYLKMQGMVIGPDFAMGRDNEGDIQTLKKLGTEMGFTVKVIPPVKINGDIVSSTAIRDALAKGDMEKAQRLFGRHFSLRGKVIRGKGRGHTMGFPTANIAISKGQALPADGVYATLVHFDGQVLASMTNVGTSPTFGDVGRRVEVYIPDFNEDLYDRELELEFVQKLRGEKRFATPEELKQQMAEDVKRGNAILRTEAAIKNG